MNYYDEIKNKIIDNDVEKIFVYYTDESIKKIEKATKTELNKIIDNSYLICEK